MVLMEYRSVHKYHVANHIFSSSTDEKLYYLLRMLVLVRSPACRECYPSFSISSSSYIFLLLFIIALLLLSGILVTIIVTATENPVRLVPAPVVALVPVSVVASSIAAYWSSQVSMWFVAINYLPRTGNESLDALPLS
jgi:hypothetical protein